MISGTSRSSVASYIHGFLKNGAEEAMGNVAVASEGSARGHAETSGTSAALKAFGFKVLATMKLIVARMVRLQLCAYKQFVLGMAKSQLWPSH